MPDRSHTVFAPRGILVINMRSEKKKGSKVCTMVLLMCSGSEAEHAYCVCEEPRHISLPRVLPVVNVSYALGYDQS